jgi:hypothetical protein
MAEQEALSSREHPVMATGRQIRQVRDAQSLLENLEHLEEAETGKSHVSQIGIDKNT